MSANLIALHDRNVSIHAPDGLLTQSPGFASVADRQPVFGEAARQQARLHPRESFNQFWSQLSLDPLTVKSKHFRHAADLAHGHLQSLTEGLELDRETVIAVPSNYTRNQLSVLLGIVRTCDIPVNGLVDQALLQAMASDSGADTIIVVDLQLHQAVLSSFHRVDGHLQRDRVVQVPASGLLALQDAWTNLIADEFIRQTRFDPKHNAEIEQHLYNQLGQWLQASADADELLIDLNHQGNVHQARLTHAGFEQRARAVFERIRRELDPLRTRDSSVHILRSQLSLPGLTASLPGIGGVDDMLVLETFHDQLDQIRRTPEQLQFITALALPDGGTGTAANTALRLPTHILCRHKAIALPLGKLLLAGRDQAETADYARTVTLEGLARDSALILERGRKQLELHLPTPGTVLLNGKPAADGALLSLGDELVPGENGPVLQLIQVE